MTAVFKFDGTLQCGLGQEIPLSVMQADLEQLGAIVTASEKRRWPGMLPAVCGAPTGMSNVFSVDDASWPLVAKAVLGAGYRIWEGVQGANLLGAATPPAMGDDLIPWPWMATTASTSTSSASVKLDTSRPLTDLLGKRVRIYRQGDMITQDYRLDRVNLVLTRETAVVADVWFG